MGDKERLEEIKSRVWRERCTYAVGDDSSREGYRYILSDEDYHWLLGQVEHRQKLLERLNKRGVEVRKLKNQLNQCREKIKKLNWNLFVTEGTADQAMRANESNYELAKKLEEENKRLREALEFYADKEIYEPVLISEAQCIDGNWVEPASHEPPTIYFDKGETAIKALEGKE